MSGHEEHETEILTDEQIDEGPAGVGDAAWRDRLQTAQDWHDLSIALEKDTGVDAATIRGMEGSHEQLVAAIAEATDEDPETVDTRLNRMTEYLSQ